MRSRWIFITIFILTALDVVFTHLGLQSGIICEANPLMGFLIEKCRIFAYVMILFFVAAALYFLYRAQVRVRWLQRALTILLAVKASVILLHLQWILNLLSF